VLAPNQPLNDTVLPLMVFRLFITDAEREGASQCRTDADLVDDGLAWWQRLGRACAGHGAVKRVGRGQDEAPDNKAGLGRGPHPPASPGDAVKTSLCRFHKAAIFLNFWVGGRSALRVALIVRWDRATKYRTAGALNDAAPCPRM
jgi:hypothetical protein